MNKKGFILIIGIIVIVLGIGYVFGRMNDATPKNMQNIPLGGDSQSPKEVLNMDTVGVVDVGHTFVDGTHTYAGKVNLPSPCHELSSTATIAESFPEQVTIDLTASTKTATCPRVITPEPFTLSFTASEGAQVSMRLNDVSLQYRVVSDLLPEQGKEDLASSTATQAEDKKTTESTSTDEVVEPVE